AGDELLQEAHRQVVYTGVAGIFEQAQGDGLAGTGNTSDENDVVHGRDLELNAGLGHLADLPTMVPKRVPPRREALVLSAVFHDGERLALDEFAHGVDAAQGEDGVAH